MEAVSARESVVSMSLPLFIDRAGDALQVVFGERSRAELCGRLESVRVGLAADNGVALSDAHGGGFCFAANLLARLYGAIEITGDQLLVAAATKQVLAVNPRCDLAQGERTVILRYGAHTGSDPEVAVMARGWNVLVDQDSALAEAEPAAAFAAASIGVGEVFRIVFSDWLGDNGRLGSQPGSLNLVTLGEASDEPGVICSTLDLGKFYLVGCGAIGQAAAAALAVTNVRGELVAVDHEAVEMSNLQRYVLSDLDDIGGAKTSVVANRFASIGSQLAVTEVPTRWGEDERSRSPVDTVLTALDSGRDRIAVQAGLARRIYNAGTHPEDLGWSRHEHFGEDPCLACMYLPTVDIPSRDEEIATALGQRPPRILGYLIDPLRISQPLAPEKVGTLRPLPTEEEADLWTERSLLDDLVEDGVIDEANRPRWVDATVEQLYIDGICGGAILTTTAELPREVLVPMAHQSALAGVMLAVELIVAADEQLRSLRTAAPEGRFNVLVGLPQSPARARTNRTANCLCTDADYVGAWNDRWGGAPKAGTTGAAATGEPPGLGDG
jgi:molybdopterin/thiamine biosynthesis adenylyltransferase